MHAQVIYISEMSDDAIRKMHMIPAHSLEEAMDRAKALVNKEDVSVIAIPEGVSVVVNPA